MHATDRFAAVVSQPATEVRLDEAAFCIAACAHPSLDIDAACARLDALAQECDDHSFDGVARYCADGLGLRGNTDDYGDPENSFLDAVLARRLGIPITLAVVMIELGRRVGVPVAGVGMPGHFLVADGAREGVWCDPFHGFARCDLDACRALFARVHGAGVPFAPSYLSPVTTHAILARMLANLEGGRLAADPRALEWMCTLHLAVPDVPPPERSRLLVAQRSARARWN